LDEVPTQASGSRPAAAPIFLDGAVGIDVGSRPAPRGGYPPGHLAFELRN